MERFDTLEFHVYVRRDEIGYSVIESRHISGGWVRTSSHLFFQEALDEKNRCIEKGLRVVLVDTSRRDTFPRRTYYSPGEHRQGVRVEHPHTHRELEGLKSVAKARCGVCRRPLQGEGYPDVCPTCPECNARIEGTQNRCTRERGHKGEHRCSAGDVDERDKWRAVSAEEIAASPGLRLDAGFYLRGKN